MTAKLTTVSSVYKLPAALLLIFGITTLRTIPMACLAFALGASLLYVSGLGRRAVPAIKAFNLFSIFVFATVPWQFTTIAQDSLMHIAGLSYTLSGLGMAAIITLKGNAIILISLALACSSSLAENAVALRTLKVPAKLVSLIMLTARHIQSFMVLSKNLHNSAKLRGFKASVHPRSWRTSAYFIGVLLLRCLEQTRRTEAAMRLRGFSGHIPLLLNEDTQQGNTTGGSLLVVASASLCLFFTSTLLW